MNLRHQELQIIGIGIGIGIVAGVIRQP